MTKTKFLSATILVAAAFLAGCAKEPLICAAPEAIDSVRSLLVDSAREMKANNGVQQLMESDDPQKISNRFYEGVKVALNRIVSGGYRSDARMRSCNAELVIETPAGDPYTRDIDYRLQMQEGQDNFVITVKDAQPLITRINTDQAVSTGTNGLTATGRVLTHAKALMGKPRVRNAHCRCRSLWW